MIIQYIQPRALCPARLTRQKLKRAIFFGALNCDALLFNIVNVVAALRRIVLIKLLRQIHVRQKF
jgi:hypothetical protein